MEQLIQDQAQRYSGAINISARNDPDAPASGQKTGGVLAINPEEQPAPIQAHPAVLIPTPLTATSSVETPSEQPEPTTSKYREVSRALLAAWPSLEEINLISDAPDPVGSTNLLRKLASYSVHPNFAREHVSSISLSNMLLSPDPRSHPIHIARKLLMLGIFLQYLRYRAGLHNDGNMLTAGRCQDIMSRLIHAACTMVTNNDDLVGSVEGIECLMLESLYKDTAGSIRRSWVVTRRAMVVAQMMGLHRGRVKVLEPETRTRFDAQYMWFRIVQSDRYLSLMLGLPQGCSDNTFATPKVLRGCQALERFSRLDTVACGRIIQRNDVVEDERDSAGDIGITLEIDGLLQQASDAMPPSWWLVDGILSTDSEGRYILFDEDTMRLVDQIAHYNLLVQLHLPYLLRSSQKHAYDYNKMTTVNASREVLRRFSIFRKAYPIGSFCRGLDFLTFVATSALCLAHLECRRLRNHDTAETTPKGNILECLTHQWPTDRALMERATECLEHMATSSGDRLAARLSTVLRHLLAIEADSASNKGGSYSANVSPGTNYKEDGGEQGNEGPSECDGCLSEGGNVLYLYIPYYGTVKIERLHGVSKSSLPVSGGRSDLLPLSADDGFAHSESVGFASLQSSHEIFIFDGHASDDQSYQTVVDPELAAGSEDWTLQGIDMVFFDSLIRGMSDGGAGKDVQDAITW